MKRPSKFIKDYIKERKEIKLTDNELEMFTDIACAFHRGDQELHPVLSEEKEKIRKHICVNCEHFRVTEDKRSQCKLCGCDINKKIKNAQDHCPIEKWDVDRDAIKEGLRSAIKALDDMRDTDWYAMMSHEDFEELNRQAYLEAQKNE